MLIAAHPTKDVGDIGWPVTEMYTFTAPNFSAFRAKTKTALSIGGGSQVKIYKKVMSQLVKNPFPHVHAEIGNPGG